CFFQAEDGIRDRTVTGVQTCALPIYPAPGARVSSARRAGSRGSAQRDQVHLGRAHEVVLREPADRVGGESDAAVVVADLEVRVVVLDVGDVRERVHEAHGAVEVAEGELAADGARALGQRPVARDLREESLRLGAGEWGDPALTGPALARGELAHASPEARITARDVAFDELLELLGDALALQGDGLLAVLVHRRHGALAGAGQADADVG